MIIISTYFTKWTVEGCMAFCGTVNMSKKNSIWKFILVQGIANSVKISVQSFLLKCYKSTFTACIRISIIYKDSLDCVHTIKFIQNIHNFLYKNSNSCISLRENPMSLIFTFIYHLLYDGWLSFMAYQPL